MQQRNGIVREPTHKEEHDDYYGDLGSPGLLLVQKEGGIADSVSQRRHYLGGGGASRGCPAGEVKVKILYCRCTSHSMGNIKVYYSLPVGTLKVH